MVNAGDIVEVQITTQNTFTTTPEDVLQGASSILASEGYGVVGASISQPGILDTILGAGYTTFQADLKIQVPNAFGQASDVASIVANAFYQETGNYPTTVSAVSVQTPGGAPVSTGVAPLSTTGVGGSGTGVTTAATDFGAQVQAQIKAFLDGLKSLGTMAIIGIIVLAIALMFFVGYSPNTRHVAGAFA